MPHERPRLSRERRNRVFATSGVVIEWYDFMIYGLLATTLQKVFYPTADAGVGLILTFATFAIGYLARPIGGIVIGRLGDTQGRRKALVLATTLMLIPLFVTTILPGYDQIGVWAPITLTLMRFMQGFSVGGEFSGALTTLSESGDQSRRGRNVSLGLATAMGGILLASIVVFLITFGLGQEAVDGGAWRIPYAIGLALAVISIALQRKMRETDSFETTKQARATGSPLRELLRDHPMPTVLMFTLAAWSGVTLYTLVGWLPTYLQTVVGLSESLADASSAFVSFIYIVVIMPIATLGDRVGRRILMFGTVVAYAVLAIPAVLLIDRGEVVAILLAMAVLATLQAFVDSSATTEMTGLVPTRMRYTGLALTYSLGMIVGSLTPTLEEGLVTVTGSILIPALVIIGISVLLLPVIWVIPRYNARARQLEIVAASASR